MHQSSIRGIFIIPLILTVFFIPAFAFGQVDISSFQLEETSIIELTNDSNEEISSFRIWLAENFNLKSFKAENGWTGQKNSADVLIFTSSEPIKPKETVKFGIKTDKTVQSINWKALNSEEKSIDTGKTIPEKLPLFNSDKLESDKVNDSEIDKQGIKNNSFFKIIPEKPNVGSTIRVTGDNFGASQEYEFFIDSKKLGTFVTDENGYFVTTMKIPKDEKSGRVDFKIKDNQNQEKKISIRIGELKNKTNLPEEIPLTIKGIPEIVKRGDKLEISGTGNAGGAIVLDVISFDGQSIHTRSAEINSNGKWELLEPLSIALDLPLGKYTTTISDGRDSKLISWNIETNKKIIVEPVNLKIAPKDLMIFEGAAIPNIPIEFVLKNPLGNEIASDIKPVDKSGEISFEYQTTQNTIKGTYTLEATQENHKEFIYVGVGQLPTIPVNMHFEKLNYKSSEDVVLEISGKPFEIINLLLIDPSDRPKGDSESITIQPDGKVQHIIDLDGFASGLYTIIASKGSSKTSDVFTVGFSTGSGEISIKPTKIEYHPGDPILVLGNTNPNVLLTMTLLDPQGNTIKTKETFSNKDGKISEGIFRIPSDADSGEWSIKANSGSNFVSAKIDVVTSVSESMVILVNKGNNIAGIGDTLIIKVFGADSDAQIEIVSDDGEIVGTIEGLVTNEGNIDQIWVIPEEIAPGKYTIKAVTATQTAENSWNYQ